jgi:hypothetical protein
MLVIEGNDKLRRLTEHLLEHWCPGCKEPHFVDLSKGDWNGDTDHPTCSPALNIMGRCHYYILDGKLVFCTDCSHDLAGKTVLMKDFPEGN